MTRILLALLLALGLSAPVYANPVQQDAAAALEFLSTRANPRAYRFFSTTGIPAEYRDDAAVVLSFVVHSLAGSDPTEQIFPALAPLARYEKGALVEYQKVPHSNLYYVVLGDLNWTKEAWEFMAARDGYYVEPLVHPVLLQRLQTQAQGNPIVRADWFIRHAMDSTKQTDLGETLTIYENFLYALHTGPPKTFSEFKHRWGVTSNGHATGTFGTIIADSSIVARHNRVLHGVNSPFGSLYETYDVPFQIGNNDFVEQVVVNGEPSVEGTIGEVITYNSLGLQVYALRDGQDNLVTDGDTDVVRHTTDVLGDVRVRVPHSCITCHKNGLIETDNSLYKLVNSGINVVPKDPGQKTLLEHRYLRGRFTHNVKRDNERYAQVVEQLTGLPAAHVHELYGKIVKWYEKPVNLKQAAREIGVSTGDLNVLLDNKTSGRLAYLVTGNKPIPRDIWEAPAIEGVPGAFQEAMVLVYNLISQVEVTAATTEQVDKVIIDQRQDE